MRGLTDFDLQVKEINELRFVLCPKRMNDAQFWIVYFSLARKYMPAKAYDPGFQIPEGSRPAEPQRKFLDLQKGIQQTFDTAKQTASKWRDRATNTLQPAGTLRAPGSSCPWQSLYLWTFEAFSPVFAVIVSRNGSTDSAKMSLLSNPTAFPTKCSVGQIKTSSSWLAWRSLLCYKRDSHRLY